MHCLIRAERHAHREALVVWATDAVRLRGRRDPLVVGLPQDVPTASRGRQIDHGDNYTPTGRPRRTPTLR